MHHFYALQWFFVVFVYVCLRRKEEAIILATILPNFVRGHSETRLRRGVGRGSTNCQLVSKLTLPGPGRCRYWSFVVFWGMHIAHVNTRHLEFFIYYQIESNALAANFKNHRPSLCIKTNEIKNASALSGSLDHDICCINKVGI